MQRSADMAEAPWDRQTAMRNTTVLALPFLVATYALVRERPRKLLLFLPLVAFFLTGWRRFVCARCRYYGQECVTMLGILTERMMPPDEERPLDRNAMLADFAYVGFMMTVPMRQILKRPVTAILFAFLLLLAVFVVQSRACPVCENDFCPLKQLNVGL